MFWSVYGCGSRSGRMTVVKRMCWREVRSEWECVQQLAEVAVVRESSGCHWSSVRFAVGVSEGVWCCGWLIMVVSYDFLFSPNMCSLVGWGRHGLDVMVRINQIEYWRIVFVSLFLIMGGRKLEGWTREDCDGWETIAVVCDRLWFGRLSWKGGSDLDFKSFRSLGISNHNPSLLIITNHDRQRQHHQALP